MGVSHWLARWAARRAHVLVVEVPGSWLLRAGLEQQVMRRGWRLAESPADADVLAVCGVPGSEMSRVIEAIWQLMPGPRVRVYVRHPGRLEAALAEAAERLLDTAAHRRDARNRPAEPEVHTAHGGMDHGGMDHGGMDHGGMDHGGMEMAPAGIPLAEGGEDRDGLEMDVLHVRLGPVLPHWPAGLVLRCSLQGDVIVDADGWLLDDGEGSGGHAADPVGDSTVGAARRCDNAAGMLALAGWEDAAAAACRIRDALLTGPDHDQAVALEQLGRTVGRSRLLGWSLRGLRPLRAEDLRRHGIPGHLRGDTYDRLLATIERAHGLASGAAPARQQPDQTAAARPSALAHLVTGLDLATARLVVASLDLDPLLAGRPVPHG